MKLPIIDPKLERSMALSRRQFCELAVLAAAAFEAIACGEEEEPTPIVTPKDDGKLPTLGGAPDTHEGRTIAAFVDAVIPHAGRDPDRAPGALDANAAAVFFDPGLPALALVGILVLVLDSLADEIFPGAGKFAELTFSERDKVIELGIPKVDQLDFAIQLAKLAFLSSPVGASWLGYPGANQGYTHDPEFSFGRAMSRTITTDGNLD